MNKKMIRVMKYSNHTGPAPTVKEILKSLNKLENKIRAKMGGKIRANKK